MRGSTSRGWCSIRRFLPLAAALFAVAVGYGAVLPIVPALLDAWMPGASSEATSSHTGILAAVYMLAIVVLSPMWGMLSDRRGRRGILLLGMAGHAAALVAFPWAQSMGQAYVLRFAAGAFAGAVVPAVLATAAEVEDIEQRTTWLAWLGAANLLGYLVGPAISGGTYALLKDVRGPLYVSAAIAIFALLATYLGARPGAPGATLRGPPASSSPYGLVRVAALSVGTMFGLGAFEVGLTVLGSQRLQLRAEVLAVMFAECSAVMLLVQAWLAVSSSRASRFATTIAGIAFGAMTVGFSVLALSDGTLSTYIAVALIAAGSGALLPLLTLLASLRSGIGIGAAIGVQTAAANLGQGAGSAAAGLLYGIMSRESFWLYAALMAIGAGAAARR